MLENRVYILTERFSTKTIQAAFLKKIDLLEYVHQRTICLGQSCPHVCGMELIILNIGVPLPGYPIEIPGHKILEYRSKPFPVGETNE